MCSRCKVAGLALLLAFCAQGVWSQSKPRVAIVDFRAQAVSEEDARIVSEIFRSRLVAANVFEVVDRTYTEQLLAELEFQQSGLSAPADAMRVGTLMNAQYLITGSLMRLRGALSMTANMIDARSGRVVASADIEIPNWDSIYERLTVLTEKLIQSSLGLKDFTLSTKTTGFSIEVGVNGMLMPLEGELYRGAGFSTGFSGQFGDFAVGFYTMWCFNNIQLTYEDDSGTPRELDDILIGVFGALNFIYGDKVEGFALQVGLGSGYDFSFGINVSPSVGFFYRNYYMRYYPTINYNTNSGTAQVAHQLEVGYSFFLGRTGKPVTAFE